MVLKIVLESFIGIVSFDDILVNIGDSAIDYKNINHNDIL